MSPRCSKSFTDSNVSSARSSKNGKNTASKDSSSKSIPVPTRRSQFKCAGALRKRSLPRSHRVKADRLPHEEYQEGRSTTARLYTKKEDPFLYFSLSKKRLDRVRYAWECPSDSDNDIDDTAERKSRFSVEVHPMHDGFFGQLFDQSGTEQSADISDEFQQVTI